MKDFLKKLLPGALEEMLNPHPKAPKNAYQSLGGERGMLEEVRRLKSIEDQEKKG